MGWQYKAGQYLSLIKFSHTLFALPFALIGFGLAVTVFGHDFEGHIFLKVLICMVTARTSAMAFNRYLDRDMDARNPRTATREIPAGRVSPREALGLTLISSALFLFTTWTINPLCFYLSFLALAIILFYSYTKKFTSWCHLVLGLGLSLSPIGAFLAVTGYFAWIPVLFSLIVMTWVAGFDILYSLQDMDFDRDHALHSVPSRFGISGALWISRGLHLLSAAGVILVPLWASLGWVYWLGAALFLGLLVFQHRIVGKGDLSRINLAFATTNGVISLVYAFFTLWALWAVWNPDSLF